MAQRVAEQMVVLQQMMTEIIAKLDRLQLSVDMQSAGAQPASSTVQPTAAATCFGGPSTDGQPTVAAVAAASSGDGQPTAGGTSPSVSSIDGLPPGSQAPWHRNVQPDASDPWSGALLPAAATAKADDAQDSSDDDVDLQDSWWREFLAHPAIFVKRGDSKWCNVCGKWDGYGHVRTDRHQKYSKLWTKHHHLMQGRQP